MEPKTEKMALLIDGANLYATAKSLGFDILAVKLEGLPGVFALAGDTDGVDGAEEIAGRHQSVFLELIPNIAP